MGLHRAGVADNSTDHQSGIMS